MKPKRLKQHRNYSEPDYTYLKNKGYTDGEIKGLWDRQDQPCHHTQKPFDIVGWLNGQN